MNEKMRCIIVGALALVSVSCCMPMTSHDAPAGNYADPGLQSNSVDDYTYYWILGQLPSQTNVYLYAKNGASVSFGGTISSPVQIDVPADTFTSYNVGDLGYAQTGTEWFFAELSSDNPMMVNFDRMVTIKTGPTEFEDVHGDSVLAKPPMELNTTHYFPNAGSGALDDILVMYSHEQTNATVRRYTNNHQVFTKTVEFDGLYVSGYMSSWLGPSSPSWIGYGLTVVSEKPVTAALFDELRWYPSPDGGSGYYFGHQGLTRLYDEYMHIHGSAGYDTYYIPNPTVLTYQDENENPVGSPLAFSGETSIVKYHDSVGYDTTSPPYLVHVKGSEPFADIKKTPVATDVRETAAYMGWNSSLAQLEIYTSTDTNIKIVDGRSGNVLQEFGLGAHEIYTNQLDSMGFEEDEPFIAVVDSEAPVYQEITTSVYYYLRQYPGEIGPQLDGLKADAGPDQTVDEGDTVLLDGSGSKSGSGGGGWSIETVDNGVHLGYDTSIALDTNDYAYISYWDTSYNLKYAGWTGSGWDMVTVDSAGKASSTSSIALDKDGYPHISYHNEYPSNDLKYARLTKSGWIVETVDSGYFASMALDSNDFPHISYFGGDYLTGGLRYAMWNGSAWSIESLDSPAQLGRTSIALNSSGYAHISYYNTSPNYDLKYARRTGSAWSIETVDSGGSVGASSSIALDKGGYAHISYMDATNGYLKYARWTGSAWNIEILDSSGWIGATSIALDDGDQPHISYFESVNDDLKYIRWTGSEWNMETVDSLGNVGFFSSLALDSNNHAHVSYWDNTNFDLKYARWTVGGGNIVSYEWDFTSDGTYDYVETANSAPDGSFDGIANHIYGDNGIYTATLRVTDETGATDTDTCNITVNNVAPTVTDISAYAIANVTLRLAGEKWHDASMHLYEGGLEIGNISIVRYPGSPDDQSGTIEGVIMDLTKEYSVKVIYTPDDDPVNGQPNGANPAWIILTFEDGSEQRIHHTFNVNHPETWEWDVNINQNLAGHEVIFQATGYDPGSDDLGFEWSVLTFVNWHNNDGTTGVSSTDPYPSPDGTFPFEAADVVKCAFPGSGIVVLKLWDDDGDVFSTSISLA